MRKRNRVETVTVGRMIIIAAAADRRKTNSSIHVDRRIAIANFKMDARYSIVSCMFQKIVKQPAPDAAPASVGHDGEQQQLGLVGDCPEQGEADRVA